MITSQSDIDQRVSSTMSSSAPALSVIPATPMHIDAQGKDDTTPDTTGKTHLNVPGQPAKRQRTRQDSSPTKRRSRSTDQNASDKRRSRSSESSMVAATRHGNFALADNFLSRRPRNSKGKQAENRLSLPSKPLPTLPSSMRGPAYASTPRAGQRRKIRFNDTAGPSEFGVMQQQDYYSDGDVDSIYSLPDWAVMYYSSREARQQGSTDRGTSRDRQSMAASDSYSRRPRSELSDMSQRYKDYTTWSKRRQRMSLGTGAMSGYNSSRSGSASSVSRPRSTTPDGQRRAGSVRSITGSIARSLSRKKKPRVSDTTASTNPDSTLYEAEAIPPRAASRMSNMSAQLPPAGTLRADRSRTITPGALLFLFGFLIWPLWWVGGFIYPRPRRQKSAMTWPTPASTPGKTGRSWATSKRFKRARQSEKHESGASPNVPSEFGHNSISSAQLESQSFPFDDEWTEQDQMWRTRNRWMGCTIGVLLTIAIIVLVIIYARQ